MGIRAIMLLASAAIISPVATARLVPDSPLSGASLETVRAPAVAFRAPAAVESRPVPTPGAGALMLTACVVTARRKRS